MKVPSLLLETKQLFADFRVNIPTTIHSNLVQVSEAVRFTNPCHDVALETVNNHMDGIFHDLVDIEYGYLVLKYIVDGPVTDGNREQVIDDCKIQTIIKLESYIEGVTNNIAENQHPKTTSARLQAPEVSIPDDIKINAGCNSSGSTIFLPVLIVMLYLLFKSNVIKFKN